MILEIVFIIIGLGLLVYGANFLVDGASSVARKFGVSEFVIGLTIVGFGTSCPELVVSITGAIQANSDIAIGNVCGSNVFNVLLILGITAFLMPVRISETNKKRDIPITFIVTVLCILFALTGGKINRIEGIIFILLFATYLYLSFKYDNKDSINQEDTKKINNTWKAIIFIILGLIALLYGGNLIVNNAVKLAHQLGISEKVIAITLLAGGTSLPELVTCIVAAAKKKDQLALGNILGSNVFNILLVLGSSAAITPISTISVNIYDLITLFLSGFIVLLWTLIKPKTLIDRSKGAIMLILYLSYIVSLFLF